MTLVVGTDEAGYGPNLGPLVVAATAWEAVARPDDVEAAFATAAADIAGLWGDSKRIFRGGDGFAALERGALAGVACCGGAPAGWNALLAALGATEAAVAEWMPAAERLRLPRENAEAACPAEADHATAALAAQGLRLRGIRCRLVQPREFNGLLACGLNKSDILSTPLVQVISETPEWSAYRIGDPPCRIEFAVRGESRLPVALASMTAKYVRELSMAAFNAWWCDRVAGLAPTAGYPVDAARWRGEAEAAVVASGLDWDEIWRRA